MAGQKKKVPIPIPAHTHRNVGKKGCQGTAVGLEMHGGVTVALVVLAVEIAAAVTNADRVLMAAVGPRRTEFTPPQPGRRR